MTPLQKDPAKAEAIIRSAIHVFARDGLERGKIADIAKEAGIESTNENKSECLMVQMMQ